MDLVGVGRVLTVIDVLIVDAKSDLNVYKTLEPSSCCGSSGCSTSTEVDSSKIDFNEWAGKSCVYQDVEKLANIAFQGLSRFTPLSLNA